ncbi:MAG: aminopeptidase [Verrucomicrobiales bacterium]
MMIIRAVLAVTMLSGLSACGTVGFYTQALRGQWEVQRKARPIAEVADDPAISPATRTALNEVPGMRRFAVDSLGLPENGSYTTYTDLGRPHVVWVVFAAGEFSIEPKRWWYPLVGSVAYRGYFSEPPARLLAARLQADNLETYVGGVDAYSTLGLLRDPVLNTFIHRGDAQVAELIFHELTHQKVYLAGDTEFNEALATAHAEHGVRRWLTASGRRKDLARYSAESRARRAFIALALDTRRRLAASYAATVGQPTTARRAAKQEILDDLQRHALGLRQRYPFLGRVDKFFHEPVTNARLATLATYYDLVPGFESLLARYPDDAEAFFAEVEALGKLPKTERHAALRALIAPREKAGS